MFREVLVGLQYPPRPSLNKEGSFIQTRTRFQSRLAGSLSCITSAGPPPDQVRSKSFCLGHPAKELSLNLPPWLRGIPVYREGDTLMEMGEALHFCQVFVHRSSSSPACSHSQDNSCRTGNNVTAGPDPVNRCFSRFFVNNNSAFS